MIPPPLPADEYTGEAIAAVISGSVLLLTVLAFAAFTAWRSRRDTVRHAVWLASTVGFLVAAAIIAALFWWGMYPWKAEYHEWRAVTGTVATIDSRLAPTGQNGGMEDKYVITYQGSDQEYGVMDTRAASVQRGDTLSLTCVRRWQWSGTHGYDCNFLDATRHPTR